LEAKTRKEGLEKSLQTLKTQQAKAYIKSPIDGIIEDFSLKMGEMANPGFQVARVINLNQVYINSDISEAFLGKIKTGTAVSVIINGMDKEFEGKVASIGDYINPNNRTFRIRVSIPSNPDLLKPNLVTTLKIRDYFKENGISVPSNTIQTDTKGAYVYIIDSKTKIANKVYIQTGISYKGSTLVTDGLQPEMQLVTQGHRSLSNNEEVEIL
jgi:membrane fusion protein, multidrug efflux system